MTQTRPDYLTLLSDRVVVFDGAMGSSLQTMDLSPDDFEGLDGCNEVLVRSRPDAVRQVHEGFLRVGCHVVETNTFGANRVVLAEYGIAEQAEALNRRAAELAREVVDGYHSAERPRLVAGSIGPGTKLPTLGHITLDELVTAYREQVRGLLDGGADLLLIETCQDLLQTRAALLAARRELARAGRRVPLQVSLTMELTGTMLLGTDLGAALAALLPLRPDVIGLNCATGPLEMKQHVRQLARECPLPIAALPNAGLPENRGGRTFYPLTPEDLANWLESFVKEDGVRAVGGCCGTTPEHLARVVERLDGVVPAARRPVWEPAISSLFHAVPLRQEPAPLLVGERTNANGSKKFRELLLAGDHDGMVALAREQEQGGAHALDLCTAYVGRDEVADITGAAARFTRQVKLPLCIDSTQPEAMEAALKLCAGRCLLNSINLEDGEERAREILTLARDFGAAVVALAIDEQGMARDVDRKLAVAHRLHDLACGAFGLAPEDLVLDMLTFTVASGDATLRDAAVLTLEAIERVKKELPGVHTILGVSNISFGLKPRSRHVLNSVFLHMAVQRGLDMAIVEARRIVPLARIDAETRQKAEDLLLDRGEDPLAAYMDHFAGSAGLRAARIAVEDDQRPLPEILHQKVVDGDRTDLDLLLSAEVTRTEPLEIINGILIPAMKEVGELFGSGQMQLPFVLQSAEVMKQAVGFLEPLMERDAADKRGTLVLATVKGDVHDIGKNLVDILLSNNGFRVINLGIKVPVEEMVRVYEAQGADAIGMSGLLVKSTLVMRENLEVLRRRGLCPPVLLGGAALTRHYVEHDLRQVYGDAVHYGKDAFEGLTLMQRVMAGEAGGAPVGEAGAAAARGSLRGGGAPANVGEALSGGLDLALAFERAPEGVDPLDEVPTAPFFGVREVALDAAAALALIHEPVLFRGRWQYRRGTLSAEAYERLLEDEVRPAYRKLRERVLEEGIFRPRAVYGYWPCFSRGNELVIVDSGDGDGDGDGGERLVMRFPRQRRAPYHCIADFFRAEGTGAPDVLGAFVVTVGAGASARAAELFESHKYRDYLHFHGLSVEAAEGAAELVHHRMRQELGIAEAGETEEVAGLLRQTFRGSRYSFGYPACPDMGDQFRLFQLLDPSRIGVTLTENAQMVPEQSVSAVVVHHPAAKYFAV